MEVTEAEGMECGEEFAVETENQITEFKLGSRFDDYESMMASLEKYSLDNNYVYTTVKSKSISSIQNKVIVKSNRVYSSKLKMLFIVFGCKHYGNFRSSGKGIRPNQKSYKSNCPSHIEVKADHRTSQLVVTRFIETHNHPSGPEIAQLYPERRRLTKREQEIFREQLSSSDVSPALLQDYVRSTTKKAVSSKDIYNLRQRIRSPQKGAASPKTPSRVHNVVHKLEPREVEDHAYAGSPQVWEQAEYVPEFLDEREVDYVEDADATSGENVLQVDKVNEAWKCVYMVLEEENKGLKEENRKLREEMKRLKAVSNARNTCCVHCSKNLPSHMKLSHSRQKLISSAMTVAAQHGSSAMTVAAQHGSSAMTAAAQHGSSAIPQLVQPISQPSLEHIQVCEVVSHEM